MNVSLQPAYVLHSRPFRDTSVIVEVLSRDHGRLGLLAKGYRGKNNRKRFCLDAFTPLVISWQGRGELKFVTTAEASGATIPLSGDRLYCGLYGNEILVRLLPQLDPHPHLFEAYANLLTELSDAEQLEPRLRVFEIRLLEQLGYGIDFSSVADTGEPINPDSRYSFTPDFGFIPVDSELDVNRDFSCEGKFLCEIAAKNFESTETCRVAKRIMRLALEPHLGDRPLNSRKLFRR